jgi:hypothetical protein
LRTITVAAPNTLGRESTDLTGNPAATHAPKPPITSVVCVKPSSWRRSAARLEE